MKKYLKRQNRSSMIAMGWALSLLLFCLSWGGPQPACSEASTILSLGEDSYIPKGTIEGATGVKFIEELGKNRLEEVSVVILSNIDHSSIPGPVRSELAGYVRKGGSLLITGGDRSFGSGGYDGTDLGPILPFRILYQKDWQSSRRGQIESVASGHPVFSGIDLMRIPLVDFFNNMANAEGVNLIAQFSKFNRQPMIAEREVGNGLVFGIAFSMTQASSQWPEGNEFCLNLVKYLLQRSSIRP